MTGWKSRLKKTIAVYGIGPLGVLISMTMSLGDLLIDFIDWVVRGLERLENLSPNPFYYEAGHNFKMARWFWIPVLLLIACFGWAIPKFVVWSYSCGEWWERTERQIRRRQAVDGMFKKAENRNH